MHSPRTHRPGRATLLAAMLVLPLLTACGKQDASFKRCKQHHTI